MGTQKKAAYHAAAEAKAQERRETPHIAVTVTPQAAAVTFGTPRQLFGGRYLMDAPTRGWDASGDGQRFVLRQPRERPPEVVIHMNVVQNWLEELKCLVPLNRP
jgi:hypothetical protein